MTTIPTLFVYFLYDHIPTFFYIFKKCFLLLVTVGVHPDLLYIECLQPTFFTPCIYVHVDIKKILNKNKNISEKMSDYVGFSPHPHTSYIYAVISDYCKPTKQAKPCSVCRKYVGGGENPTYSLIFSEMFLFL